MKYGDSFEIEVPSRIADKIAVIKAIRSLSKMGLVEAKDIVDRPGKYVLHFSGFDMSLTEVQQQHLFDESARVLNVNGVLIQGFRDFILKDLRRLAAQAMEQAEDDLANEILQLIMAEKLKMK